MKKLPALTELRPGSDEPAAIVAAITKAEAAIVAARASLAEQEDALPDVLLAASDSRIAAAEAAADATRRFISSAERMLGGLHQRLRDSERRALLGRIRTKAADLAAADEAWLSDWQREACPAITTLRNLFSRTSEIHRQKAALYREVERGQLLGGLAADEQLLPQLASEKFFGTPEPMGALAQLPAPDGQLRTEAGWFPEEPARRSTWRESRLALHAMQQEQAERAAADAAAQAEMDDRLAKEASAAGAAAVSARHVRR